MVSGSGYVLCGTPRTGSTLLCGLLSSTGVLGRPESYFREPDERAWAERLGVPVVGERAVSYSRFAGAVQAAGSTDNGVFAARIMWGSVGRIVEGLGKAAHESDAAALERALGPLSFIHLRREDVVSQAVSWARAEQTGFWHHGDTAGRRPRLDLRQLTCLYERIHSANLAWRDWFRRQGVEPYEITYEGLVSDPGATVRGIADWHRASVPASWEPSSPHRRQADETNQEWSTALRDALARPRG